MPSEPTYRIAYVDTAHDMGGAEKSLLELTSRLDTSRFTPVLLHTQEAVWLEREPCDHLEKIPVFSPGGVLDRKRGGMSSRWLGNLRDVLASAGPIYQVRRGLRHGRAHLVHTNTLKGHLFGGLAARLSRLPLIWHMRDLLDEDEGLNLVRQAAATFKPRIIAISAAVAQQFADLPVQVDLVPNGIPLERFTPGEAPARLRQEWSIAPDEKIICCVGRLTPWKGHRTLLRAFGRVLEQQPRTRLLVIGEVAFWEDEYEQELHELATELALGERVIWAGFRPEVPEILCLCDLLVLPSHNEPFGRVLIEAMSVGKAVVATQSGGAPEIVEPEETGLLVPPEDPEALAQALVRLLHDDDLRARLGQAGQKRAGEKFDVRRVVKQVESIYVEVLGG